MITFQHSRALLPHAKRQGMEHVTIGMPERYAHLSPDARREAVGGLERPFAPTCDSGGAGIEPASMARQRWSSRSGYTPIFGHSSLIGHSVHFGFLAVQV